MSNIILCGFKGCGKSTLGQKLAKELAYAFVDTDNLILQGVDFFRFDRVKASEIEDCEEGHISQYGSLRDTQSAKAFTQVKTKKINAPQYTSDDCRKFYKEVGEEAFRLAEKNAILSLQGIEKTVIATGAGAVLDPQNALILKKIGKIIYLKEPKDVVKTRLLQNPYPAAFKGKDLEKEFEEMYVLRAQVYESISTDVWEIGTTSFQVLPFANFPHQGQVKNLIAFNVHNLCS